jgi:chitinase
VSDTPPSYPLPRNVIYFFHTTNPISLAGIANLPYTDVVLGFLIPDSTVTKLVKDGSAFPATIQSDIKSLQAAGQNVLISVGGGVNNADPTWTGWTSAKYKTFSANVPGLVQQIVSWVAAIGANGVDIDFEDSHAFTGEAGYDGIAFLSALTSGLSRALPPGSIITHAPQTPYWDQSSPYKGAYAQVHAQVGNSIAWYNNQFYNNPSYDSNAAVKVAVYLDVVAAVTGPTKALMGVSINAKDEGAIGLDDMTQNVIQPLAIEFPLPPQSDGFGGVMAWEFAFDSEGAWAYGIGTSLGLYP